MQFKKYYKDILSLVASLSLLGAVYFVNHYDIKQLYREFAGLRLKVQSQEKQIEDLQNESAWELMPTFDIEKLKDR